MKKRDKLTVIGMSMYCGIVFSVFLAWGIHSSAVDMPEPVAPKISDMQLVSHEPKKHHEPTAYITTDRIETSVIIGEPVKQDQRNEQNEQNVIENCTITYYCAERYAHICGTGDGVTATGAEATPGMTCAVDPAVIPFGSVVMVDYGDGALHEYIAQDSGAWVNEDHVDLCVATHSEALALGRRSATVYWEAA